MFAKFGLPRIRNQQVISSSLIVGSITPPPIQQAQIDQRHA
jgi:hypothetical protein